VGSHQSVKAKLPPGFAAALKRLIRQVEGMQEVGLDEIRLIRSLPVATPFFLRCGRGQRVAELKAKPELLGDGEVTQRAWKRYQGFLNRVRPIQRAEFYQRLMEDDGSLPQRFGSALAKFGALTGQTESFAALSQKYGWKIRALAKTGQLPSPARATPSREVLERAIAVLRDWDARHFLRTGEARAYHLAARLQLETTARSVSVTRRLTRDSLRPDNQVLLVGKGGKEQLFTISPVLHRTLELWFAHHRGPLAAHRGYQSAYARAMLAAGGRVTGTHGARRRGARDGYLQAYREAVGSGLTPAEAARKAAGDAVQALGHSRHRRDHRSWYLGR
jgi:hypothetical protein